MNKLEKLNSGLFLAISSEKMSYILGGAENEKTNFYQNPNTDPKQNPDPLNAFSSDCKSDTYTCYDDKNGNCYEDLCYNQCPPE